MLSASQQQHWKARRNTSLGTVQGRSPGRAAWASGTNHQGNETEGASATRSQRRASPFDSCHITRGHSVSPIQWKRSPQTLRSRTSAQANRTRERKRRRDQGNSRPPSPPLPSQELRRGRRREAPSPAGLPPLEGTRPKQPHSRGSLLKVLRTQGPTRPSSTGLSSTGQVDLTQCRYFRFI